MTQTTDLGTAHAARVLKPHQFADEEAIKIQRVKLARAINMLGEKWLLHPSRRIAQGFQRRRDACVVIFTVAGAGPLLVADILAKFPL